MSTGTVETHPDNTTTITKIITYRGPAGYIDTEFTLTRDSAGKITAITAEYRGNDHEDLMYHRRFNTSASKQIVGKKIQDLSFDAVGGASLTTDAFNKMIASL